MSGAAACVCGGFGLTAHDCCTTQLMLERHTLLKCLWWDGHCLDCQANALRANWARLCCVGALRLQMVVIMMVPDEELWTLNMKSVGSAGRNGSPSKQ